MSGLNRDLSVLSVRLALGPTKSVTRGCGGARLVTYLSLVPKLRMSGPVSPHPYYFMASAGRGLSFQS